MTIELSDARKQLSITKRELSGLQDRIKAAVDEFDFDAARKLKKRKGELEEKLPKQEAIVLRLEFNQAESEVERLRQEVEEKKSLQLESRSLNTKYQELARQANENFNLASLEVAQAESRLKAATREVIELGLQLEEKLESLAA